MSLPNTAAIFSRVGAIAFVESMTAANNTIDITSGTSYLICTADATNGGWVREVRVKVNPANNSAATVIRLWINNGSTTGTSSNTAIFSEISLPATTASATAALPDFSFGLNLALNPGYKLYATMGTAVGGSCELTCTAVLGAY